MPTLSILLLTMTGLLLSGCASPQMLPVSRSGPSAHEALELRRAVLAAPTAPVTDRQATAERDAAEALRAMNSDLLACFARGGRAGAEAHITAEIVVGGDGGVRHVTTTGGALVGPAAMRCFERRITRARFTPAYTEGTARLTVPFSFVFEPR